MKTLIYLGLAGIMSLGFLAPCSAQIVQLDYASAFQKNTTAAVENFSFTDDVMFTPTTFVPSSLSSFFSGSLGNGSKTVPATGTLTATVYLVNTATNAMVLVPDVTLTSGPLTTLGGQKPTTFSLSSTDFPEYLPGPAGTFDELLVTVSGSLSPNAFASFLGEVNVQSAPEPSVTALLLFGLGSLAFLLRRRASNI